jgi:8-oxo-dGTP diphosphatase
MRRIRVAAAVVLRDGLLLLTQRPPGEALGLQWEFPGGKIERGESPEQALVREIREELGVRATPREVMGRHRHAYPHGIEVHLTFVRCDLDSTEFRPSHEVHAVRWVRPADVDLARVLPADRDFLVGLGAMPPAAPHGEA